MLRYVDEAALGAGWKWVFLSTRSPTASAPTGLLALAYAGAAARAIAVLTLVGLIRTARER